MDRDGDLGLHLLVARFPSSARCWYWAVVVRTGRPTVAVVETDAPMPARSSLELRASGLWADHTCEQPLEHWGIGLEAAGVAVEDPADLAGSGWGFPTPVGLDLGWEAVGDPEATSLPFDGFEQDGSLAGEVLVGDESLVLRGRGRRRRLWGDEAAWGQAWAWGPDPRSLDAPGGGDRPAPVRYEGPSGWGGVLWRSLGSEGAFSERNVPG